MADNALMRAAGGGGVDTSMYRIPEVNPLQDIATMQSVQNARTQNELQKFSLAHQQLGAIQTQLGALAAKQDISFDDVIALGGRMSATGLMPREAVTQELQNLSRYQNDPEGLRKALGVHIAAVGDAALKLQAAYGTPSRQDAGGSNVGLRTFSTGGVVYDTGNAARVARTLTPGEKTQTQDYIESGTGAGRKSPIGELYDERGNFIGTGGVPVYRGGARAPAGSTAAAGAPGASAGPQGGAATASASVVSPAPAPASQAGSLPTSLGAAAATDIATSAKEFTDLRNDIAPSRDRVFGLVQAIDALRSTNTGQGTAGRQKLLAAVNAFPGGKMIVPDSKDLSDYDIAKKYLSGYMMNRPGAGRSDAALATSAASTPNVDSMTNPAAIETAQNFVGQERMRQAQAIDFINRKGDPGAFSNHSAKEYSKSADPKAFALGVMTPEERAAHVRGLQGEAKTKFLAGVRMGLSTGVLSREDLIGAAGAR